MTRYLISFDDGAMKIPEEELPDVAEAAHNVVQEAKNADVWVFGGGVVSQRASVVATDGTATDGPYPETKAVISEVGEGDLPPFGSPHLRSSGRAAPRCLLGCPSSAPKSSASVSVSTDC